MSPGTTGVVRELTSIRGTRRRRT